MLTLIDIKTRPASKRHAKIKPKIVVQVKSEQQRAEVKKVAKRVMDEHYDVLLALKNR